MDLDAYASAHGPEWDRLARLARGRRPSGPEADELIDGYQAGATQLAAIRTSVGGSTQGEHLSLALWRARLLFTGARPEPLRSLTVFVAVQLPAALYRIRWLTLALAAATVAIAAAYFIWLSSDPRAFATLGLPSELERYAESDFVDYYSTYSEAGFAAQVWTNNAWIAAQCVMFGILGVWVPFVIFQNAQGLGISAAVMNHHDRLDQFFLYIAPHGQLELYSIFLAGAAGLMIFWSWIAPGARTRAQALAQDGRAFFTVVVGLVVALLVSGLIEGFVTRQDWPWVVKIGIGTLALAAFLVYQWVVGRRAFRAGELGDLDEFSTGARRIVSV
ncbi:stage II sporulation protein M [Homoserinibacter sp. GY 40078]|uniref:stage II sporulation protein M n=1 Tax=Homoserinibacter sp. GY 40078 TaxID=2603275 RepID=UPI0011C819EE|nr:stage II sporulation protein M [Homoserinibacter sp. GY 40078]TXK16282.1 stage II sporulation protein M [Homoserinibacter sp. GY 40078]